MRVTEKQKSTASATVEALQLEAHTGKYHHVHLCNPHQKHNGDSLFIHQQPCGGCRDTWLQQLCRSRAALRDTCDHKVMGIPLSWAQRAALKRLKPQQSRPQGLIQSGLHGGKITQISLQRAQKHLPSSLVWLSSPLSQSSSNIQSVKAHEWSTYTFHWDLFSAVTKTRSE